MKYIFPRQFGLHNVFTCDVDKRETSQPFKDYTLREQELNQAERAAVRYGPPKKQHIRIGRQYIPRRLRGGPISLVKRLQIRHARCSYERLLKYYCPVEVSPFFI